MRVFVYNGAKTIMELAPDLYNALMVGDIVTVTDESTRHPLQSPERWRVEVWRKELDLEKQHGWIWIRPYEASGPDPACHCQAKARYKLTGGE